MFEKDLSEVVGIKIAIDGIVDRINKLKNLSFDLIAPGMEQPANGEPCSLLAELLNTDRETLNAVCRSAILREFERMIEVNRQQLKELGVKLVDDERFSAKEVTSAKVPKKARRS